MQFAMQSVCEQWLYGSSTVFRGIVGTEVRIPLSLWDKLSETDQQLITGCDVTLEAKAQIEWGWVGQR